MEMIRGFKRDELKDAKAVILSDIYLSIKQLMLIKLSCASLTMRPSDKTILRTGSHTGPVSAVKDLDLNQSIEGLGNIQEDLADANKVVQLVESAYGRSIITGSKRSRIQMSEGGSQLQQECMVFGITRS
jgi:hypothetical protein